MRRRWVEALQAYLLLVLLATPLGAALWFGLFRLSSGLSWTHPLALSLLAAVPLVAWVGIHLHRGRTAAMQFSRVQDLKRTRPRAVARLGRLPTVMRATALAMLACALAGPLTYKTEDIEVEGIDVMLVLDLSQSMAESDVRRSRLDAGQRTIRRFLRGRRGDRVGLVVFADGAMLASPLTLDYPALDSIVADLAIGDVPERGTASGDGVGLALASLRRSEARSRMIVLVSDGDETKRSTMDSLEAATLAAAMEVKIFTILMGRETRKKNPGERVYDVDPELMRQMAIQTGGQFFRAGDHRALARSFEAVRESMEKTRQRVQGRRPDMQLYSWFAGPALGLLLLELGLSLTRWRRFP